MIPLERKGKILNLLKENKSMTIEQIASSIYVSQMTVRRDIKQLENEKLVKRIRGGVEIIEFTERLNNYYSYAMRINLRQENKRRIAEQAAAFIEKGDTIYIDSSSSASYITEFLSPEQELTVVTSSLSTAKILAEKNIKHILIGGMYHDMEMSLYGIISEMCSDDLKIDKMFFSAQGIVPGDYIYNSNEAETRIMQFFLEKSKKKIFLCVNYKIGRRYMFKVYPATTDIEIITDISLKDGDTV